MKHSYEIDYENVHLRPLTEDDIESLRRWRNDPSNTLYLNKIPYITPEMQKKWFKKYIDNDDEMCFAIIENKELNRLVGSLSLYQFKSDECFFGKILVGDKDAHGRKIGLNATMAATKLAFEKLQKNCVKLFVFSDHQQAYNVYTKAGFHVTDEHETESGRKEFTMSKEKKEGNNHA